MVVKWLYLVLMRFVVGGCLWFLGLFGCSLSVAGLFLFSDFVFAVL